MTTRLAYEHEIVYAATHVLRTPHESAGTPRLLGDVRNCLTCLTLKTEMIERRTNLALRNDHDKVRVGTRLWCRPYPDRTASFKAPLANDRQTANLCEETNPTLQVCDRIVKCVHRPDMPGLPCTTASAAPHSRPSRDPRGVDLSRAA